MLWALVPLLFGLHVTTVASGSMEPRVNTGDVVAAMPIAESELRVNQVILFEDPAVPDRLKFHRIVGQSAHGLKTQGDANPEPDPMAVAPEAVVGVGAVRVPWVGIPLNWVHSGQWLKLAAFLGALGAAALLSGLDRDLRRRDRESRGLKRHRALEGPSALGGVERRTLPLVAALLTAATALYAAGGSSASAAFSSQTTASSSLTAAEFFKTPWERASFHWPYSEGILTLSSVFDDSGNGRNGSLLGLLNTRPSEAGNQYIQLDGITSQITSQRSPGAAPNSFSLETWFKTSTTQGGKLMGYGNSQSGVSTLADRHLYMANSGKLYFGAIQGGQSRTVSSPSSYNDGRWHLATVTMAETEGSVLYVDGVPVGSSSSMTQGQSASDGYWRVGYDSIDSSWPDRPSSTRYGGGLDGTSLYSYPLSPSAVAAHYSYGR